jgi:cation transporter-like permease
MVSEVVLRGVACGVAYFVVAATLRYTLDPPTLTYPVLAGVLILSSAFLFRERTGRRA